MAPRCYGRRSGETPVVDSTDSRPTEGAAIRVTHVSANGALGGGPVAIQTLVSLLDDVEHVIATDVGSDLWQWARDHGLSTVPAGLRHRLPSSGTLLHLHGQGALALAATRRRLPSVLTVHGLFHVREPHLGRTQAFDWLYRRFDRQGWPVVFVARADQETAVRRGLLSGPGHLIPNPTVLPDGLGPPPGVADRGRTVAWIGRFEEFKRPELAIAIARQCPDVGFTMVGDGAGLATAQRIAPANVVFTGRLPRGAVLELLGQAAVCLSTSRHEGLPFVLAEASLRGACPAGPDVPGVGEIVRRANGRLVAPDAATAASELSTLLDELATGTLDEQLAAGTRAVAEHFDPERNARAYHSLYQQLWP